MPGRPLDFGQFMSEFCTASHLARMREERGLSAQEYRTGVARQFLRKNERALRSIQRRRARDASYEDEEEGTIERDLASIRAYMSEHGMSE